MKSRTLKLVVIFVLLLAASFLYKVPYGEYFGKKNNKVIFPVFKTEDVNRVEIKFNKKNSVLDREGEKWKVVGTKGFYVSKWSAESLDEILKNLGSVKLDEVSNGSSKDKLGFNEGGFSEFRVHLKTGEEFIVFIGGGSSYSGSYLMKDLNSSVYYTDSDFGILVSDIDWRDRGIFDFDKLAVNKIRFQYQNNEFELHKESSGSWSMWVGDKKSSMSVNKSNIEDVLLTISNLKAASIPEQNFSGTGLEKNIGIVQVYGEKLNYVLMIGNKNKDGFLYAKRGDSDNIYLVASEDWEKIGKSKDFFIKKKEK